MAEQHHQQELQQQPAGAIKNLLPEQGPSVSQILAVVTLFAIGGFLLMLACITLTGTVIGLAVTTPVFVIFSPVLIPASLTIALAVTGFLTSGAFGITALSSLSWIVNYIRQARDFLPEQLELAKRHVQDTAGHVGYKVKDVGQRAEEGT